MKFTISWRMINKQHTRGAEVYLCAGTSSTWRIRAEMYPDDKEPGWFGGKVLWGHDQDTLEKAEAIARRWTEDGVLPAPWGNEERWASRMT